jgi:hypothetical protein
MSPYGTFDQGGNVFERVENSGSLGSGIARGGYYFGEAGYLAGTGLLVIAGLLGLVAGRRPE